MGRIMALSRAGSKSLGGRGRRRSAGLAVAVAAALAGCAAVDGLMTAEEREEAALSRLAARGAVQAEQAGDAATAARHWATLHGRDPSDVAVAVRLARALRALDRPADAIAVILRSRAAVGNAAVLLVEQGKAEIAAGRTDAARATLEAAVAEAPEMWEAQATLGIALDRAEDFAAAQAAYQRALELSPGNVTVLNNLGLSLALSGRLAPALARLRAAAAEGRGAPEVAGNLALLERLSRDAAAAPAPQVAAADPAPAPADPPPPPAAPAPPPAAVPTAEGAASAPQYIVQEGGILRQIAEVTGVGLERLEGLNPALRGTWLGPGTAVRLPDDGPHYLVREGGTLARVAAVTERPLALVRRLNPTLGDGWLPPGTRVRLPAATTE